MAQDRSKTEQTKTPASPKPTSANQAKAQKVQRAQEDGHDNMQSGGVQKTKSDAMKRRQM